MRRLMDGGTFFEGPRWHDGRWWVSDFFRHVVLSFAEDGGDVREEAHVAGQPSGLGWAHDGSLLIVSMLDRRLLRRSTSGDLEEVADLSALAGGPCNDLVVSADGHAYVGNFGYDFWNGERFAPAALLHVAPDGAATVAADDLRFPNGSVITDDGTTLIVGETFGAQYTAFTIGADGGLSDRRTWAAVPGVAPDGCGLDERGRIWAADAVGRRCVLVAEGGEIVDQVSVPGEDLGVFACMLGGADGRTLLLCCAPDSDRERRSTTREAVLLVTEVDVPRGGRP